jgi:hypothetical protein
MPSTARQVPAKVEIIGAEMRVRSLQDMDLSKTRPPVISSSKFEIQIADG